MDTLGSQLTDILIQKLFRIFLLFTEESSFNGDSESAPVIKHHIHRDEAHFILSLISLQFSPIQNSLDIPCTEKEQVKDPASCDCERNRQLLTFKEFIGVIGEVFPSRVTLEPAVAFVYDQLVNQLLKKEGKSEAGKWFWSLKHAEKTYNFAATDKLDRQQWIAALELAILRSEDCGNFHRNLFCKRKLRRNYPGPCDCSAKLRQELRSERNSRVLLETEKKQLQQSLEQEHRAVKDEGIVRNLAARMLEEERLRREELEILHAEQGELLRREKEERRRMEEKERKRGEELQILRIELEQLKSHKDREEANHSLTRNRSTSTERQRLIQQLKKDQTELLNYQRDLQSKTVHYTHSQDDFFREIGGALEKLMDKSQKRHSVTESMMNGSVRHIDKIIYTPSRSSSESS